MSNIRKLRDLRDRTKAKAKRVFSFKTSDSHEEAEKTAYKAAVKELEESPAFNSLKFFKKAQVESASVPVNIITVAQDSVGAIVNPGTAIKTRVTRSIAGVLARTRPYASIKADLDFLQANDDLNRVLDTFSITDDDIDDETKANREKDVTEYKRRLEELEISRLNTRVAWITARNVQRVRVVDETFPSPFPDDSCFEENLGCGLTRFNWAKWFAYKLVHDSHPFTAQYIDNFEERPFGLDTLGRQIVRLFVAGAPIQKFYADLRRLWRWEDPLHTGKWLLLYSFFCATSQLMSFFFAYIICNTIKNYQYPTSASELRSAIQRTEDLEGTAIKLGELMDKHGQNDWLIPFLEQAGPHIQMQVADMANLFESIYNFYNFRSPPATISTLYILGGLFFMCAVSDGRFTLRFFEVLIGFIFFFCWPISSLYPHYRLVVSPFKWILWNVPTHAEWSFQYLQERSVIAREAILSAKTKRQTNTQAPSRAPENSETNSSTPSIRPAPPIPIPIPEQDILSFSCTYLHTSGTLTLSTATIRFESGLTIPQQAFQKPYATLLEISKPAKSSLLTPRPDKLELWLRGEKEVEVIVLEGMKERDRAFNALIGFSGLRWQNLQRRGVMGGETEKKI